MGTLKTKADDFLHELMQTEAALERIARKLELEFAERFVDTGVGAWVLCSTACFD